MLRRNINIFLSPYILFLKQTDLQQKGDHVPYHIRRDPGCDEEGHSNQDPSFKYLGVQSVSTDFEAWDPRFLTKYIILLPIFSKLPPPQN